MGITCRSCQVSNQYQANFLCFKLFLVKSREQDKPAHNFSYKPSPRIWRKEYQRTKVFRSKYIDRVSMSSCSAPTIESKLKNYVTGALHEAKLALAIYYQFLDPSENSRVSFTNLNPFWANKFRLKYIIFVLWPENNKTEAGPRDRGVVATFPYQKTTARLSLSPSLVNS